MYFSRYVYDIVITKHHTVMQDSLWVLIHIANFSNGDAAGAIDMEHEQGM